jgi:hypothetical protein
VLPASIAKIIDYGEIRSRKAAPNFKHDLNYAALGG